MKKEIRNLPPVGFMCDKSIGMYTIKKVTATFWKKGSRG